MAGNIADFFGQHRGDPARRLYRHCVDGAWRDVTVAGLAAEIARWQAAFRREGLAPGDRVALAARNGVAWVAVDLAALGLGLVVVPLFVDDNPGSLAWCIGQVEPRLVVLETARLAAALRRPGKLAAPPRMVVLRPGDAAPEGDEVVAAARFLPASGTAADVEIVDCAPDALATICFTSGTAGRPKGVMLSHGNVVANVTACRETGMARGADRFLSLLPLSHMFERTGGYYLPLAIGAQVTYARGLAHLADDLAAQAPTVIFAVPRLLERLSARIDASLAASPAKRRLFEQCVARGIRVARRQATLADRALHPLLAALVARPILARLGGRLRLAVVGGAPLDPALAWRFIGLGLVVLQGYGMTEAAPVVAVNLAADNRPDTVGPPLPGVEVALGDGDELLVRGPNVMLGYWRNPDATRAAIASGGWLRTGDVARIEDGRITIRGRLKDILVLSTGEKLPPHDVEHAIARDPVFEQVMLVGEGRPFLVLLAVVRTADGALDEPTLVRRANEQLQAFPRWVRVRRVVATTEPWSVDGGLLTPTLKLKRPTVVERFRDRIDEIYGAPGYPPAAFSAR